MQRAELFAHSLRQVTGNLRGALRVSLVPYAVQLSAGLLIAGQAGGLSNELGPVTWHDLLSLGVSLFTSLWIAVAWHRYILRNEMPRGLVPPVKGAAIWAYFLRSLGYGLMLVALGLALGFVMAMVAGILRLQSFAALLLVSALVVYLPVGVVAFRLMTALPAAALEVPADFMSGWRATEGRAGPILGMTVIFVTANFAVGLIREQVFADLHILVLGWDAIVGWFFTMVGASILTTLYGHYIERRRLNG